MKRFLKRNTSVLLLSLALAALLLLLRWLEIRFLVLHHLMEVYMGLIAALFTALGIWLALRLARPKTIIVEKEAARPVTGEFVRNQAQQDALGLTKRELEVLGCLAAGLSNQEIARQLFVSLNTVKTHTSRLFEKMDVKRRTQAVEKARRLGLIP